MLRCRGESAYWRTYSKRERSNWGSISSYQRSRGESIRPVAIRRPDFWLIVKKANENTEAHLRQLTEAVLVPLKGKKEADISSELRERIEKLFG